MDITTVFRAQAYNNAWANHRLISACRALSSAELHQERVSFFPSIIETLNHNLTVDWFYVSALEGHCDGYKVFDEDIPFAKIEDLHREQSAIDERLIAAATDPDPDASITLVRRETTEVDSFARVFLHLIQHQIHHRGQVHAMLAGTPQKPPQLDEFFLGSQSDIALRAPDLAKMGVTEEDVWGPAN